MTFTEVMEHGAQAFEAVGACVLVAGFFLSLALALRSRRRSGTFSESLPIMRACFGGALLLGLEILVAADLIRTVAVAPTLSNVGVLGLIVLIRTFLSFSLEIEMEGVPPWRRALVSGATVTRRAVKQTTRGRPRNQPDGSPAEAEPGAAEP
ncbi:putative membrane protein [Streptacidiphilus sp. MAP12-33]|uniref:DUF1622 domain-containing protein n=1 Tax=Streptacidiphilus sp. MAP12-33 TaxID=3156266 RepID=UPI0035148565